MDRAKLSRRLLKSLIVCRLDDAVSCCSFVLSLSVSGATCDRVKVSRRLLKLLENEDVVVEVEAVKEVAVEELDVSAPFVSGTAAMKGRANVSRWF